MGLLSNIGNIRQKISNHNHQRRLNNLEVLKVKAEKMKQENVLIEQEQKLKKQINNFKQVKNETSPVNKLIKKIQNNIKEKSKNNKTNEPNKTFFNDKNYGFSSKANFKF